MQSSVALRTVSVELEMANGCHAMGDAIGAAPLIHTSSPS